MFSYEKNLQYPVKIKNPNPNLAKIILTQYGGPDGELGASLRYLCYSNIKVLLASNSPRRRELLGMIMPEFGVAASRNIDETYPSTLAAEDEIGRAHV